MGSNLVLSGDTTINSGEGVDVGNGNNLDFGAYKLTVATGSWGVYVYFTATIAYLAGAELRFAATDFVELEANPSPDQVLPPTFHTGSGQLSIVQGVHCASFAQSAGSTTSDTGAVLTVDGAFSATGGSLTNLVAAVGGAATASNTIITGCDFSGGTALAASVTCTDGGGNTNVTFQVAPVVTSVSPAGGLARGGRDISIIGTDFVDGAVVYIDGAPLATTFAGSTLLTVTTPVHAAGAVDVRVVNPDTLEDTLTDGFTYYAATTWTSVVDGDWGNGGNWNAGAPDADIHDDVLMGGISNDNCNYGSDLYVKSIDLTGYTGAITRAGGPGVRFVAFGNVTLDGAIANTGIIYCDMQADATIISDGYPRVSVYVTSGTMTLGDDLIIGDGCVCSGNFHLGANGITWNTDADLNQGLGIASYSGGATLTFAGTTDISLSVLNAPPTFHTGSGDLLIAAGSDLASYSQSAGTTLSTSGITVLGNFLSTGGALDTLTCAVAGTAVAHDTVITNCDFSGGTELDASDGCTDGGGNTNVDFGSSYDATQGFFGLAQ